MTNTQRDSMNARVRPMTPRGRPQRGMTLVELMVASALGLFLIAVMGTIYLGSKGTFQSQDTMARLQEDGRFAMDTISTDLRMAGFRGCLGAGKSTTVSNTLNSPTSTLYNFSLAMGASRKVGSVWAPALDSAISNLSPAPSSAGDVLTIRRPVAGGWGLTAEMNDGYDTMSIGSPSPFHSGDLLMVTDCNGAAVFQATNNNPTTTGSIAHTTGGSFTPGLSTSNLGRAYLQDAMVYRMETVTYYLAPSARPGKTGITSLWSYTNPSYDGSVQPAEIVTGVEKMAVAVGVDTDGDRNADVYTTPDAVTDWSAAVSSRIELLFASPQDNVTTSPQKYVFNNVTVTPADRKLRTVMTLVSSHRNSLP